MYYTGYRGFSFPFVGPPSTSTFGLSPLPGASMSRFGSLPPSPSSLPSTPAPFSAEFSPLCPADFSPPSFATSTEGGFGLGRGRCFPTMSRKISSSLKP